MYKPGLFFDRTPGERKNIFKSWARTDQALFAAGACHILADLFVQLHQHKGYKMIYIKPSEGFPGSHAYASNGVWAFDHNGYTKEVELLSATEKACAEKYPGWRYQKIIIESDNTSLEDFCKKYNHRLPWQFAYLPWERAHKYIASFNKSQPT